MQEDKTVPIDTSGESLEVTLEEENVKKVENEQTPAVEVEQTTQSTEEEKKPVEDETKEYSASVKKRIDKLTKRLREAERREEAAVAYAQGVQKESKEIKSKYETLDKNYIDEFGSRVENQLDLAKKLKSIGPDMLSSPPDDFIKIIRKYNHKNPYESRNYIIRRSTKNS